MKYKKIFKVPIYKGKFAVCIGDNIHEAGEAIGLRLTESAEGFLALAVSKENNKGVWAVLFPKESIYLHGAIAHEAKHIVNYIFADRGVLLDTENDEAECYFLGWVVDRIYEAIQQYEYLHKRNTAKP